MAITKGTGTPPNSHFFARLRNLDAPESDNIWALAIKKKKGDFSNTAKGVIYCPNHGEMTGAPCLCPKS